MENILEACDGKFQAIDFITPGNEYCMVRHILFFKVGFKDEILEVGVQLDVKKRQRGFLKMW